MMPDPLVDAPEREVSERHLPPRDRPPVDFTQAPHAYVESEFPQGKGHCDMCGGGPDAEIHHPLPEPLERIAAALERIATQLEQWSVEDDFECQRLDIVTRRHDEA